MAPSGFVVVVVWLVIGVAALFRTGEYRPLAFLVFALLLFVGITAGVRLVRNQGDLSRADVVAVVADVLNLFGALSLVLVALCLVGLVVRIVQLLP
jgi:hypothetical protein